MDWRLSFLRDAIWSGPTSPPTQPPDGSPDRSPRLFPGSDAQIYHSRQRWFLRSCRRAESASDGHPGPTNYVPIALANRTHRTAHRLDPPRMLRSSRGPKRWASTPSAQTPITTLLPDPPRSREGRSTKPASAEGRMGPGHSPPRRTSSSIRPDGLVLGDRYPVA
jgi:hypothetical protein